MDKPEITYTDSMRTATYYIIILILYIHINYILIYYYYNSKFIYKLPLVTKNKIVIIIVKPMTIRNKKIYKKENCLEFIYLKINFLMFVAYILKTT